MPGGSPPLELHQGGDWDHDNLPDLFQAVLSREARTRHSLWVVLGTLAWTLWTSRNRLVIEHVIPIRATDSIYKLSGFLQLWRPLSKRRDRDIIDNIITGLRSSAAALAPPPPPPPPEPD